jgi:hypothetical protein
LGIFGVMSMRLPKSAFLFSRRERGQLEAMGNSSCHSAGLAIRAPKALPIVSEKHIQQIACPVRLFEIDAQRL